jgi:MoaA/NifB/PqqE/SkfB family radical SAM enzyme
MCDIWKGNAHLRQLNESDIMGLLDTFIKYQTQQVVMSGGEALLNPDFFRFCEILKSRKIKITLLSTGLTIQKHAERLIKWVDDIIISLDGDEVMHDTIRNIPGAFKKLKEGIRSIRLIDPQYPIAGRSVIHRLNFRRWPEIILAAKEIGLHSISFLPADVSSTAFNRESVWTGDRQQEIVPEETELDELRMVTTRVLTEFGTEFESRYIVESRQKIQKIYDYYAAYYGHNPFPYKKCNAPWVSTVIEADGSVRPCFFHKAYGNIKDASLYSIINSDAAVEFRKKLDMDNDETCMKCVCSLNLRPSVKI